MEREEIYHEDRNVVSRVGRRDHHTRARSFTPPVSLRSLAIKYHHAQENTDDQMATTRVDQVFVNESPQDIEGSISFPFQKTSLSQRSPWE